MAVAVAAEAGVAVFISSDLDIVLGNIFGLFDGTKLGVDQQTELIGSGLVDKVLADRAVVGDSVVGTDPKLDPCKRILAVCAKAKICSV